MLSRSVLIPSRSIYFTDLGPARHLSYRFAEYTSRPPSCCPMSVFTYRLLHIDHMTIPSLAIGFTAYTFPVTFRFRRWFLFSHLAFILLTIGPDYRTCYVPFASFSITGRPATQVYGSLLLIKPFFDIPFSRSIWTLWPIPGCHNICNLFGSRSLFGIFGNHTHRYDEFAVLFLRPINMFETEPSWA